MKNIIDFAQEFFDFETKNKMFDIKDNRGNYIWDIFRVDLFSSFVSMSTTEFGESFKWQVSKFFRNIIPMIYTILPIKRDNFFFMQSRDNLDGKLFDRNSYDIYKLLNPKDCFLYETYFSKKKKIYSQHEGTLILRGLLFKIFYKFIRTDKEVCKKIYGIVKSEFPDFNWDLNTLIRYNKSFYFDLWFYTKLFKLHGTKKVYFEGLYKGVCAVAKNMGILMTEVQHGNICLGSLSYSYPKYPDIENKVYLPTQISTMSDFWLSECYMPTKKIVLGNNFFSKIVEKGQGEYILVISNTTTDLFPFIKYVAKKSSEKFIYKLHPVEYYKLDSYKEEFKDFQNVQVYTNELDFSSLLSNAKKMVTIGSTCVYETLQAGIPVILCKDSFSLYLQHSHIFGNKGIRICDTPEQLLEFLSQDIEFEPTIFFQPFNKEKALEMISEGTL